MKLVEQDVIDLDSPVKQYLKNWEFPESIFSEEKITIRQLLSHSAGMPLGNVFERYSPQDEVPSLKESLSREAFLMQEPGLSFAYSNTGFNLLELVIEEVTGRDFAEYMQEEVLIPLGMYGSSFEWSEELEPAVPAGYDLKGKPVPVYIYSEKASGGLLASVEDIATFVAGAMTDFNTEHVVLTPQSMDQLYSPAAKNIGVYGLVFESYGLGHYIETLPNGKQAVSHGGQGGGCMTHFHSIPETGDGIVILTNSQRSWPLIAYILSDWAEWGGWSSVGMGKIIWGNRALWAVIGLLWTAVLWQLWRLRQGLITGKRKLKPLARYSGFLRAVQAILSVAVMSGLVWCMSQEYLFLTSVFPIASSWLGISSFALSLVLLLSTLFPIVYAGQCAP